MWVKLIFLFFFGRILHLGYCLILHRYTGEFKEILLKPSNVYGRHFLSPQPTQGYVFTLRVLEIREKKNCDTRNGDVANHGCKAEIPSYSMT